MLCIYNLGCPTGLLWTGCAVMKQLQHTHLTLRQIICIDSHTLHRRDHSVLLPPACINTTYHITLHQRESSRPTSSISLLLTNCVDTQTPPSTENYTFTKVLHEASRLHFRLACCLLRGTKQQKSTLAGLQIVALEADRWQAVLHCSRVQASASADRRSAARHQALLHQCYSQAGSAPARCEMHTGTTPLTSAKTPA